MNHIPHVFLLQKYNINQGLVLPLLGLRHYQIPSGCSTEDLAANHSQNYIQSIHHSLRQLRRTMTKLGYDML